MIHYTGGPMKSLYLIIILFLSIHTGCYDISRISGYVYDYDTGKPVKGAVVNFYTSSKTQGKNNIVSTDITDDDGRYKIDIKDERMFAGNYNSIEVKKQGYMTFYDNFNSAKDYELSIYLKELSPEVFSTNN